MPPINRPEIAFAGRSNVGKSSLVNALTGRKTLARVSHTPGRTQQLNFFDLGGHINLVDMPGYGYAAVSKTKIAEWTVLIEQYLRGRTTLQRVYVLVDGRHGLKDVDREQMATFDRAAASYQVVLTKGDEVKVGERSRPHRRNRSGPRQAPGRLSPRDPHLLGDRGRHRRIARKRRPPAGRTWGTRAKALTPGALPGPPPGWAPTAMTASRWVP